MMMRLITTHSTTENLPPLKTGHASMTQPQRKKERKREREREREGERERERE